MSLYFHHRRNARRSDWHRDYVLLADKPTCRERGSENAKRNVQILFRLTEEEAEQLYSLVKKSGCSKEAFLRGMVKGYRLCEKPDPEFYKIMRELSAIGNRINQLAAKANTLNFVDAPMLKEEARRWHEFQIAVRKKYLLPRKAP